MTKLTLVAMLVFCGALSTLSAGPSSLGGANELESVIKRFNESGDPKYLTELNQLGANRDGDYSELYGELFVRLVLRGPRRCLVVGYLATRTKRTREHLEAALAGELYIQFERQACDKIDEFITDECSNITPKQLNILRRRISLLLRECA